MHSSGTDPLTPEFLWDFRYLYADRPKYMNLVTNAIMLHNVIADFGLGRLSLVS